MRDRRVQLPGCAGPLLQVIGAIMFLGAVAQTPIPAVAQASAPAAYQAGYQHVVDHAWQEAVDQFSRYLQEQPASRWADDAQFWLCYCGERLAASSEASFECYAELIEGFSTSEWVDDARNSLIRLAAALSREGAPDYMDRARDLGRGSADEEAMEVLELLGRLDEAGSVGRVLEQIGRTRDPQLRVRLVDALEDIDRPEVVSALESLVIMDSVLMVRMTALETLGDLGATTQAFLIQVAGDSTQPSELRVVALDELSNDPASPELLKMLRSVALDESATSTALWAIEILGDLEDPSALRTLAEVLSSVRDIRLTVKALAAVSEYESPTAFSMLADHVGPQYPDAVRLAGLEGLADVESERAALTVVEVLFSQPVAQVRDAAIIAAGRIGDDAAIDALLETARLSPDPGVSRLVEDALEDIGSRRAREALRQFRAN
ncbi:MAG: HEAT repeat domain-containing protein [Thermoanaerobaculia bacterium]|nr:HEAT repeat domain-containing protein [Thermoanaerobaculia bacterium]